MTEPVVIAIITAAAGIIVAAVKVLGPKKSGEAKTDQTAGTVIQNSKGVAIATHGGTVIQQNAAPAELGEITENIKHIEEVLRKHLPTISPAQLDRIREVDAMIHPNNWRQLPVTQFVIPRASQFDETMIRDLASQVLVRYLAYAAFLASGGKYRRSIVNVGMRIQPTDDTLRFHFSTNDGSLLHELKQLFERRDAKKVVDEIAKELPDWAFQKKFAFVPGCSLEITIEPDQKTCAFHNAPLYEGENTKSESIMADNLITIDRVSARSIQGSMSKALAFLGRMQLKKAAHAKVIVHYDLDAGVEGEFPYEPQFLRLIYHILDNKLVSFDLFRLAISDPEKWDYMYHK